MTSSDRSLAHTAGTLPRHSPKHFAVLAAATLAVAGCAQPLLGQARAPAKPAPAAPAPAVRPAVPVVPGLDGMSEKAVMGELAGRGLNSLLNRLFEERKVPDAERNSIRSLSALRELANAPDNMPDARRVSLLKSSVEGLKSLKSSLSDPNEMSTLALALVQRGIEPDANILDYWGDDSVRQARVGPAAEIARELIERASVGFRAQATALEGQLRSANDPRIKQYEEADVMSTKSHYAGAEWVYYQLLGIDISAVKAKPPYLNRKAVAEPAIKIINDYDNNDSQFVPAVKLLLGKIRMRTGEFAEAKKQLQQVVNKKLVDAKGKAVDMSPEPNDLQVNIARYFLAVCDLMAGNPDGAEKGYNDLVAWQKTVKTPEFVAFRDNGIGNKAQLLMLNYRIQAAKAELAPAAQKQKLNEVADGLLNQLGGLGEDFRDLVNEQLVNKLKDKKVDDIKWADQSVPLLQALMVRGYGEWAKPEGTPVDAEVLAKGLRAAEEMASRKVGIGGLTTAQVESAKLHAALFLQKQGKLAEAADRFLDYATDPLYAKRDNVPKAMDQAEYLAISAFTKDPKNELATRVYDRMLKVGANPPFSRPNLFYYYADRLRLQSNYEEAVKFYGKIPKGDKNEFDARYWELICVERALGTAKGPKKAELEKVLIGLAAQVRTLAQAAITQTKDAATVTRAKFRLAKATLTEADLALHQAAPAGPDRALAVLNGFEQTVAGLPQAEQLGQLAVFYRARALIAAGKMQEAIAQVELLAKDPKTAGLAVNMVRDILKELGEQAKKARQDGNKELLAKVLNDRAKLSGYLLPYADRQPPDKRADIKRDLLFFDAFAKLEAADVLPPGPEKQQRYKEALGVYKDQILPDLDKLVDKYTKDSEVKAKDEASLKAVEAAKKSLKDYEDRQTAVMINIARCQYELREYLNCITNYATLLQQGKLGAARILVTDATGQQTGEDDNPDYWDAVYRLNMARYQMYQANPEDAEAKKALSAAKQSVLPLFSVNANVGGKEYKDKFIDLRKKLDPNAGAVPANAPASQPATAPTAAAVK